MAFGVRKTPAISNSALAHLRFLVSGNGLQSATRHCSRSIHNCTRPALRLGHLQTSHRRTLANGTGGGSDYQFGPTQDLQPQPNTQNVGSMRSSSSRSSGHNPQNKESSDYKPPPRWKSTAWKMFESSATTFASLAVLGLAGYTYHKYYKYLVISKMEVAFSPGDPALDLLSAGKEHYRVKSDKEGIVTGEDESPLDQGPTGDEEDDTDHPHFQLREEQKVIDAIIRGDLHGHYYLLVGEKGTGKTSMLLSAMHAVHGENCSLLEAHADLEIFRLRLGKALDYEFHEDYIGSLFSIRGPRESSSALLDIERAFNKMEKVALRIKKAKRSRRPLILIINGMHLLRDDEDGRDLLELLQQRAEAWAASGLVTMVFNSDDYWVYERLKQYATRMELISVHDLPRGKAVAALKRYRERYYPMSKYGQKMGMGVDDKIGKGEPQNASSILQYPVVPIPSEEDYSKAYSMIGGRLSFLNRCAKAPDMLVAASEILAEERRWLLNQVGILGMEMDDDVMNDQKFASAAMVLARALVRIGEENRIQQGKSEEDIADIGLPEVCLDEARRIMTRRDFVQQYDHINIFTIASPESLVRADSVPMYHAMRSVCMAEGFSEFLEETLQRINDIESLGRTREVVAKDLVNFKGKYHFEWNGKKGQIKAVYPEEEDDKK